MVDAALRRSPLAALGLAAEAGRAADDVTLCEFAGRGQIVLRGDPRNAGFVEATSRVLGFAPPFAPNTVAGPVLLAAGPRALWLGPDEWLVATAAGLGDSTAAALRRALAGQFASVVDTSDGRAVIGVAGPKARQVLTQACAIDLHPRAFAPGRCAQTLVARVGALLHQTAYDAPADAATYELYVARSVAEHLWAWLAVTAAEHERHLP